MSDPNKALLRKTLLEQRLALPRTLHEAHSLALCQALVPWLQDRGIIQLALYRAFRGEPSLRPLEMMWPREHLYYPCIDPPTRTMVFRQVAADGQFQLNRYGIEEPATTQPLLPTAANSAVLVPALAFAWNGQRLGYGAGYYDRYLSDSTALTVGICFAAFFLPTLPHEAHDHPVSMVATEAGVHVCLAT